MIEKPKLDHQLTLAADDIWQMEQTHEYPDDIECQYRGLLNFLDILYYRNGNSSYPQVRTRHTMFSLAQAMPSLAYIDPSRTKEISYNLHICGTVINFPLLTFALDCFNSEPVRLAETALSLAFYRMVSGNTMNDELFHSCIENIMEKVLFNKRNQGIPGIETLAGIYEILPNLWILMAFEIHDKIFGSKYSGIALEVVSWIKKELVDQKTGLYRESFKTGAFGIQDEKLNPDAFWHTTDLKDNVNAMVIGYMHYFDEEGSLRAWESFKNYFLDDILNIATDQIISGTGESYVSQLSPVTEALYGSLFTAKEMHDKETFDKLQKHILAITSPSMREGKLFLDAVEEEKLQCHYFLLGRVHVGWKTLMEHRWEEHFGEDYKKIQ